MTERERLIELLQSVPVDCTGCRGVATIADYLIDGPYIEEERDITLHMRGSKNQRIINLIDLRNKL